jgi:heme/copper-type cytochrome/quinol oxidase subunit 1
VGDDPYDGLTLEWATTSPPPSHNFDNVPEVRSAAPLADVRAADAKPEAVSG